MSFTYILSVLLALALSFLVGFYLYKVDKQQSSAPTWGTFAWFVLSVVLSLVPLVNCGFALICLGLLATVYEHKIMTFIQTPIIKPKE